MLRKLRDLVLAGIVGGVLVLGGTALADIPDARPSSPDSSHTFYGCYANGPSSQPWRTFYALDKSVGSGQCPPNHTEVRLVPSALP